MFVVPRCSSDATSDDQEAAAAVVIAKTIRFNAWRPQSIGRGRGTAVNNPFSQHVHTQREAAAGTSPFPCSYDALFIISLCSLTLV